MSNPRSEGDDTQRTKPKIDSWKKSQKPEHDEVPDFSHDGRLPIPTPIKAELSKPLPSGPPLVPQLQSTTQQPLPGGFVPGPSPRSPRGPHTSTEDHRMLNSFVPSLRRASIDETDPHTPKTTLPALKPPTSKPMPIRPPYEGPHIDWTGNELQTPISAGWDNDDDEDNDNFKSEPPSDQPARHARRR